MNVHIVVQRPDAQRMLPRMAELLAAGTGWSISERPDEAADVQYAFPYLELRKWGGGPFAAYFTHREETIPAKAAIWRQQAERAVLRITSAPQYEEELRPYGPTHRILPPLDLEAFTPAPAQNGRQRARPVAGVSGYRYAGGRKGEAVLTEALRLPAAQRFAWRAIGRGWPVTTRRIALRDLPDWYRSLDVYVCPSLIEGVPYGPLEALACGVPVVIPRGVGLLDELPELPGIVRYERGNAASLADGLERALDGLASVDHGALRAAVEPYTLEAWVSGHIEAFAALGAPEEPTAEQEALAERARKSARGIYVVAYGDPARQCAERLIASVRKHMPGVPVAVASERPLPSADISVAHPDADAGGRTAKTKMWELAPAEWRDVLYLDADTELVADVSFLFDALADGWDLVATKDQDGYDLIYSLWRRDAQEMRVGREAIGSDRALQIAGGVVGFRRSEGVKRFLERWYTEWKVLAGRDQGALLRALYAAPVRLLVLGCEWNSFVGVFKGETAGIVHHRGGPARRLHKWHGVRLDDPRALQKAFAGKGPRRQRQRLVREERPPKVRGKGSWFVHRTGARQFAAPGTKAYGRLAGSAAWRQEAALAQPVEVTA